MHHSRIRYCSFLLYSWHESGAAEVRVGICRSKATIEVTSRGTGQLLLLSSHGQLPIEPVNPMHTAVTSINNTLLSIVTQIYDTVFVSEVTNLLTGICGRISGTVTEEVTGEWRQLYIGDDPNLYSSPGTLGQSPVPLYRSFRRASVGSFCLTCPKNKLGKKCHLYLFIL